MSHNRLTCDGLADLRAALRALPADLTGEAGHIVESAVNGAALTIRAGYPARTGTLRDSVTGETTTSGFAVHGLVKNSAKHAYLFEHGTQARHTALGANRGTAPPGHVFVPVILQRRRAMYEELKDLLTRHGLLVSGDV